MEEVEEEEEEATHLHFRWTPLRRKDQAKGEEECTSSSITHLRSSLHFFWGGAVFFHVCVVVVVVVPTSLTPS